MSKELKEIIIKDYEKRYLQGAIDTINAIQKSLIMTKEYGGKYPEMSDIKYTKEDIDRIFIERVYSSGHMSGIKKGVIVEWVFIYPNGKNIAFVEASFPVNEDNFDFEIGKSVCYNKIKNKLWKICGQYSIITGEKL